MQKHIHKFMYWFERAPFYFSFWALPIVAILYGIALIRNKSGDNKSNGNNHKT